MLSGKMKILILFLVFNVIDFSKSAPAPANPLIRIGFVKNTPENIALLKSGNYRQNPEELSGQFEGDIILNKEQYSALFGTSKTGLINERYRWANNTVPYAFDNVFTQAQLDHIVKGLNTLESVTCLKFVPRTDEEDYVFLTGLPDGCYSSVGRQGRRQTLNLALYEPEQGCFRLGTIMHEFIHALGFYHMQSATERDDFVRIAWEHIQNGMEHNFNRYDAERITNFGVEYDVTSVMHYSAYAFSSNGYATIIPNDISLVDILGQRGSLTDKDIERLNTMYKCNEE